MKSEEPKMVTCPSTTDDVVGCGAIVPDDRDAEGLVDCPECGIFFDPDHPNNRPPAEAEPAPTRRIKLHDVIITSTWAKIPITCPKCGADLTKAASIEESRLCCASAFSHVSADEQEGDSDEDALAETDTADSDAIYAATTAVSCAGCGCRLAEAECRVS